jgi:hypothetical protein
MPKQLIAIIVLCATLGLTQQSHGKSKPTKAVPQVTCNTWKGVPSKNTQISFTLKPNNTLIVPKLSNGYYDIIAPNNKAVDPFLAIGSDEKTLTFSLPAGTYKIQFQAMYKNEGEIDFPICTYTSRSVSK